MEHLNLAAYNQRRITSVLSSLGRSWRLASVYESSAVAYNARMHTQIKVSSDFTVTLENARKIRVLRHKSLEAALNQAQMIARACNAIAKKRKQSMHL